LQPRSLNRDFLADNGYWQSSVSNSEVAR
jgi:hypothetical protein